MEGRAEDSHTWDRECPGMMVQELGITSRSTSAGEATCEEAGLAADQLTGDRRIVNLARREGV